jgi:hypothetical protein
MNFSFNRIQYRKRILSILGLMLLIAALLLTACSEDFLFIPGSEDGGGGGDTPIPTNSIVGVWNWVKSDQGTGTVVGENITSTQTPNANDRRTLQFNSDGSYIWQQKNDQDSVLTTDAGTWRTENNKLYYNEGSGFPVTYDYQISNDNLNLSQVYQDGEFAYWLQETWQK